MSETPAPKLSAIQLIEQEIVNFSRQREQAVANVHAIEGAIQAAQHLVGKLKAEAAKAEAPAPAPAGGTSEVNAKVIDIASAAKAAE